MINKLRKKFIAASMLSVLIVLTALIGAINAVSYYNIVSDSDSVLKMIKENGGSMPEPLDRTDEKTEPRHNEGSNDASGDRENGPERNGDKGGAPPELPEGANKNDQQIHRQMEMAFDTRYFTVTFGDDGTISSSDTSRVAAISQEDAEELAVKIFDSGKEKGFSGDYRFLRCETAEAQDLSDTKNSAGVMVICVDCYRSLGNFRSFLAASAAVSVAGLIAVLVLIVFLSGRAVKPVAESYEKQKRFITDAGHELKTPLTVIDADVSVLEMDGSSNEWLSDIKTQTRRLAGLTNELVYLSRMDEGRKVERLPFPVSDVVSDEVRSFAARAKVEEKKLTSDIGKDICYEGDEKMIRELVSILLDNALKYSDEHGKISVSLRPDRKGVRFSVTNTVSGMKKEQAERMFDRFYRADPSRSEKAGYGLGLSIAKAVCEAHGGDISAALSDDGSEIEISARLL